MKERRFRVLVTRAPEQASALADVLRAEGAEPVMVATIEIRPVEDVAALEQAMAGAASADWVVFTSARAAEIVLPRLAAGPRFAVVGEMTAAVVRKLAGQEPVMARGSVQTASALAEVLAQQVAGRRVVFFRAQEGSEVLPERLLAAGAEVEVVPAYRTVMPEGAPERLREVLGRVDAVTFTSASSAENLARALREAGIEMPDGVVRASIGPVTTEALRRLGWTVAVEASATSVQTLAKETVLYLRTRFSL
jgi:uroporphyrinogen-III synthase